jgi:hypothetical protein
MSEWSVLAEIVGWITEKEIEIPVGLARRIEQIDFSGSPEGGEAAPAPDLQEAARLLDKYSWVAAPDDRIPMRELAERLRAARGEAAPATPNLIATDGELERIEQRCLDWPPRVVDVKWLISKVRELSTALRVARPPQPSEAAVQRVCIQRGDWSEAGKEAVRKWLNIAYAVDFPREGEPTPEPSEAAITAVLAVEPNSLEGPSSYIRRCLRAAYAVDFGGRPTGQPAAEP